jgi:hypothetical protein
MKHEVDGRIVPSLRNSYFLLPAVSPKWRNWQTRCVQGAVGATPWRFKSSLRHKGRNAIISTLLIV